MAAPGGACWEGKPAAAPPAVVAAAPDIGTRVGGACCAIAACCACCTAAACCWCCCCCDPDMFDEWELSEDRRHAGLVRGRLQRRVLAALEKATHRTPRTLFVSVLSFPLPLA